VVPRGRLFEPVGLAQCVRRHELGQEGRCCVVITLNHRLNLFGYLYLAQLAPEFPDSGNAGILDLVAALRWVRDNAAEFGGDPGNVTIFGQSGGGAKVTCLMAMPEAAGLFHRAIVQSGSYYLKAMDPEAGTKQAHQLLAALDIQPSDARQLALMPADALVAGLVRAQKIAPAPNFRPVADARALRAGPWAPDAPAISAQVPTDGRNGRHRDDAAHRRTRPIHLHVG
jgi:para-nitrobenzyl esterase